MELKAIADELVAGCREGREATNLDSLYAEDAVSIEAADMQGMGREAKGRDAIRGKHEWWNNATEVVDANVSDPMLHGDDRFAVIFQVKGKDKASGQEFDMKEVAIYTVGGGKIVKEEFYYASPG